MTARGLHGQIVEAIGTGIVRGDHPPGSTLFAEDLERELGVSKTVVREALKVLGAKGMVESRQKRGTVVRPRAQWHLLDADLLRWHGGARPDRDFLGNLAEVRAIVEPAGARLAAVRRTEEDLVALESAMAAMVAAHTDADAMIAADLEFHRALLDAAHNELLSRMDVVIVAGLGVRDRIVHAREHWADPEPAHRAILDAVRANAPEAAVRAVEALLAQAEADLREL
ncbi:FadR/GntR family transcriptional regulator [Sciscionella marina]|uniref:FadR/GntR family transcriptional regulator n=1 Tax=Sciscionella marina TaxID=508770 RepID=UPI000369D87C|nr:FadR/GntR family transcriptional regulator [Sciscionella marina]